jgi:general stress protein 26
MQPHFDSVSAAFLAEHTIATLSTVSSDGVVHGAVIYYVILGEQNIYFVSKTGTSKITNITEHPQVAFTVFDAAKAQTLQISAKARVETDENTRHFVFDNIVKPHLYSGEMLMPPVTALKEGDYVVIHVQPEGIHFSDYKKEILDQRNA